MNESRLSGSEDLSNEIAVVVGDGDRVVQADARAERCGVRVGSRWEDLAPTGGADRLRALVEVARRDGEVRQFEAAICVDGVRIETLAWSARRVPGGVLAVGSRLPEAYSALLVESSTTISEIGELQRTALRQKQEIESQYRELAESNGALKALYLELDEKSDTLHRTAQVKARLVSHMSHEFRTPLNSILGLARLLRSGLDGPLTSEQNTQLGYIERSATELAALVDDVLDLAKAEGGAVRLHIVRTDVGEVMSALAGMCKPLDRRPGVELSFASTAPSVPLETDTGKIGQILRNLVSNALKFTLEGEVRVSAEPSGEGDLVFEVTDTGVGIRAEDLPRIFEEFSLIDNPVKHEVRGTGLGLSLSRRLATMLDGTLTARSAEGTGSTFTLRVPRIHPDVAGVHAIQDRSEAIGPDARPILVVEDDRQTLMLYERTLRRAGLGVVVARTLEDARRAVRERPPAAIVLDVLLEDQATWRFLAELKGDARTRDIPVLVVTVTNREAQARALGADEFWLKPMDPEWLLSRLRALGQRGEVRRVLMIDDDEVARYLMRKSFEGSEFRLVEAKDGAEGIARAQEERPHAILLDMVMPGMSAFEVLDRLKADPRTRGIPVIIHSSKELADEERQTLLSRAFDIIDKGSHSRELALGRIRDALASMRRST